MYSALVELMQPEIDEASNAAEAKKTVEAVDNAIKKLNMSKAAACDFMDITPAQYDTFRLVMKNAKTQPEKRD